MQHWSSIIPTTMLLIHLGTAGCDEWEVSYLSDGRYNYDFIKSTYRSDIRPKYYYDGAVENYWDSAIRQPNSGAICGSSIEKTCASTDTCVTFEFGTGMCLQKCESLGGEQWCLALDPSIQLSACLIKLESGGYACAYYCEYNEKTYSPPQSNDTQYQCVSRTVNGQTVRIWMPNSSASYE